MPKEHAEALIVPVLPLRDTVLLPQQNDRLLVGRPSSIEAIEYALQHDRLIAVVMQKTDTEAAPTMADIYHVGVIARIISTARMLALMRVTLHGEYRVRLKKHSSDHPFLMVKAQPLPAKDEPLSSEQMQKLVELLTELENLRNASQPVTITFQLLPEQYRSGEVYPVLHRLRSHFPERVQAILETVSRHEQYMLTQQLLEEAIEREVMAEEVYEEVASTLQETQRQNFIREQIRALQKQLGEDEESLQHAEANRFRELIAKAGMPPAVEARALEEVARLRKTNPYSPEYGVISTYLEWLTALPWSVRTEDNLSLENARAVLDADHYDLEKPKERILEYIAVLNLTGSMRGQILCFVGPPGVGKTSLAASIARALGRKFVRISLGGVRDEAEIRGHRRAYIGAQPGKIIQAMKRAGTVNPVILLDEVDKLGIDFRGDPAAALLEVLDPEQNRAFNDHYLEVDYDLSQVLFIATANVIDDIPAPLLDRMEVIEINSYLEHDKLEIAKRHIIPKQIAMLGLQDIPITITDDAILTIIREYTREAGVRNLEREISRLLRKIAQQVVSDLNAQGANQGGSVRNNPRFRRYVRTHRFTIDTAAVHTLLKSPRFRSTPADRVDRVGVANGLAWTSTGGDLLPVEVTIMPGTEKLLLTGKLGEVMKESAQAALSYVRANAEAFGIPPDFARNKDIHIHVPEGAIPKDGPSAGITITIALISAARGIPVRSDVAMTGEITLRGTVLPVGGLNEKLLAARRHGIMDVIVPSDNRSNIEELPEHLTSGMNIHYVSSVHEALPFAFRTPITPHSSDSATPTATTTTPQQHATG